MVGRAVTFIRCQPVLRIDQVEFAHQVVALDLRKNGGCGDRDGSSIALDQRLLLDEQIESQRINEQKSG